MRVVTGGISHETSTFTTVTTTWESYRDFLGSEYTIETPYKPLTGPYKHGRLCMEGENEA